MYELMAEVDQLCSDMMLDDDDQPETQPPVQQTHNNNGGSSSAAVQRVLVEQGLTLWADSNRASADRCFVGDHVTPANETLYTYTYRDVALSFCGACREQYFFFPVKSEPSRGNVSYGIGVKGLSTQWRVMTNVDGESRFKRAVDFSGTLRSQRRVCAQFRNGWAKIEDIPNFFP